MNAAAIPAELRDRRQWVCWCLAERDGKGTKVPVRANGSGLASTTDPDTWGSFSAALETARAGKADGIGYVFSADDPYVGIDLDHCFDGDKLHRDAGAIVGRLDSYTERSVSGTGLHTIIRADLNGHRNRTGGTGWGGSFECYGAGRYFCFTGDHLRGCPTTIEERQAELDEVLAFVFPTRAQGAWSADVVEPVGLDDEDLLDRARAAKNGAEFDRLWRGDTTGYSSHSEADLALCSKLAFWTRRDLERIDRLFRSSGLMRDKWERPDYRARTIETAIAGCSETFQTPSRPRPSTSSPPRPQVTSSLVPTPYGGDEDEHLVPDLVPAPSERSGSWCPIDLVAREAEPPQPPEIIDLFYLGLNHLVSGESESAKSWIVLAAAVAELEHGRGVLWIDGDDVGGGAILERLRALGAHDDAISRLFAYVAPEDHLTAERRADLLERMHADACRLVVLDGFNPLLHLHGLNPNEGTEVETFYRHIDLFRKTGAATVLTDNVVKSKEARGKWAIGSERKKSKAEVHLGMQALELFGRGRTGRARIDVHKDRPGHLQRPTPGIFVLESDSESCSWRIDPDQSYAPEGEFRPTHLMDRVSRYLERRVEAASRNQIEKDVEGKGKYIRVAIDRLIAEGYAVEVAGARGARLVQLQRPFVEAEEEA